MMAGVGAAPDTIGARLVAAAADLAAVGVPEPRADAEVLLAFVLGVSRTALFLQAGSSLPPDTTRRFEALLVRRAAREPVFQIVGEREFWSLPFIVDSRVLTPRPETELLVETACRIAPHARRVLDAGTGSGCIAVAVAQTLPAAQVWAVDRSARALAVASQNCFKHAPGVRLVRGNWIAAFRARTFDLIIANPPYVRAADLPTLAPEVRDFEPHAALVGGADGLDAIRALLPQAARVLGPSGWLVCEIGAGQGATVMGLARRWVATDDDIRLLYDHAGHDRIVVVRMGGD